MKSYKPLHCQGRTLHQPKYLQTLIFLQDKISLSKKDVCQIAHITVRRSALILMQSINYHPATYLELNVAKDF
jgi:hypothetical protein